MARKDKQATAATGIVTAVQHFCLHDGPGTRSVVFFKGCPLRCGWCQNPETWSARRELGFKAHRCVACGLCVERCPQGVRPAPGERDSAACTGCFTCAETCPAAAVFVFGDVVAAAELLGEHLLPERPLYERSGGGVTLSGGEPTASAPLAAELAELLRDAGVQVALETCGLFDRDDAATRRLLAAADLLLFDLKLHDEAAHRRHCGGGHARILQNLRELASERLWPRLPLVPGVTTRHENLVAWARRLRRLELEAVTLVPYHRLGEAKRRFLGLEPAPDYGQLDDEMLALARQVLTDEGLRCYAPGEEEWPSL